MNKALKIAGFGLASGVAVLLAVATPAAARGPFGHGGANNGMAMGPGAGPGGGVFAVQFSDLDRDADGKITEAELVARAEGLMADRLAELDADGDGAVTAQEVEAQILARIGAHASGRMGQGRQGGDPSEMATAMAAKMLSARDTDGDGTLSGDEMSPAADMAALIDRYDTDDDNAWTEAEFAQVNIGNRGHGKRGHDGRRSNGDGHGKRR